MRKRKETSPQTITIIGADGGVSYVERGVPVKDMSDAEVCARANADRASGAGQYSLTSAMKEELRRSEHYRSSQIYDE